MIEFPNLVDENGQTIKAKVEPVCSVVVVKTGEHCPEPPLVQIERDVWLCEKCFDNHLKRIRGNLDRFVKGDYESK